MADHTEPRGPQVLARSGTHTPYGVARSRLVAAHHAAVRFFADHLAAPVGASPREYLSSRGFGPLLGSSRWELGYAPPSWTALTEHLTGSGFEADELVTAGLAVRTRTGNVVDRFRDRLMLTVHDLAGEPVGFVGRAAPGASGDTPKYLNSPRTPLFEKRALLFGLSQHQDALTAGAVPVLVEGPLDVLAIDLANAEQVPGLAAVAPCGTALTAVQVSGLARFNHQRVLVAFDADAAGQRATASAYSLLSERFTELRAAGFPEQGDPAGFLEHAGPQALREALSRDRSLADAVVDHGLRYWRNKRDNAEACVAAVHELAPTIASLRPDDVGRQVSRVAQELGIEHFAISQVLTDAVTAQVDSRSTSRRRSSFSTAAFPRQRPSPALGLQ